MLRLETRHWILFFLSLLLLLLTLMFLYQTRKKNRKSPILDIGLSFGVLAVLLLSLERSFPSHLLPFFQIIAGIGFTALFFSIYLHYELTLHVNPPLFRFSFMSFFLGGRVVLVIFHALFPTNQALTVWYYISFDTIRFFSFLFAMLVTFQSWQRVQETESLAEFISTILLFTGGIIALGYRPVNWGYLPPSTSFLEIPLSFFLLLSYLLTFFGVALYLFIFIRNPNYIFRLPIAIHHILLFNSSGITTYSRSIHSRRIRTEPLNDQLLSSFITAIASIFTELVSEPTRLEIIASNKQKIFFEYKQDLACIVVAERLTYYEKQSLCFFLDLIDEKEYELLTRPTFYESMDLTRSLDTKLKKAFPYLEFTVYPS